MNKKLEKKSKERIGTVKNNIFAFKLLCKICPQAVFHIGFRTLIDYGEWLFYSAFFMKHVINSLVTEEKIWLPVSRPGKTSNGEEYGEN